MTRSRSSTLSRAQLDALVEEATVDCYNEDEQLTGLFTMIEDNLAVPFETVVLGVSVDVANVDLSDSGQIMATLLPRQDATGRLDPGSASADARAQGS